MESGHHDPRPWWRRHPRHLARLSEEQRRWVHVRLVGWGLIAAWQVLSLASEFIALDLNARPVRITGKLLGLAGLVLVAVGFERLMHFTTKAAEKEIRERGGGVS